MTFLDTQQLKNIERNRAIEASKMKKLYDNYLFDD